MRTSDILRAAKVLAVEHNTTKAYARGEDGFAVVPTDRRACSFCALGAVRRVTEDNEYTPATYLENAANILYTATVPYVNDTIGLAAVEKMFNLAIELAAKDEGSDCASN